MSSLVVGIAMLATVLGLSLGKDTLDLYLQAHSILIVVGGSLAIFALATPNSVLRSIGRSLKLLIQREETFSRYQEALAQLQKDRQLKNHTQNALISYASELWSQGVDANLFVVLLSQKKKELELQTTDAVQALKNLAKYPPALGMVGTVMGMVALFSKLDSNKDNIGSNLAMAMTATFFGLVLSNAVIAPLADRLHVRHVKQQRLYENIYEILLLINQNQPASLVREEMLLRAA